MRSTRPPLPPDAPVVPSPFGPFTLVERLAVGGMAEVFRAVEPRQAGEPRTIVVKRMLPHIAQEPGAEEMFAEEAWLAALVEHPNVVRVLGTGEVDGRPYLSLEWVPGLDGWHLQNWVRLAERPLERDLAIFIGMELLAGLHAVHEARDEEDQPLQIVHHDISPSNLLLSAHGDVKLSDFGIARARLRLSFPQAAAVTARTKGKLGYLSPEQVTGDPGDRRSDIFGAAVVVAELLTGQRIFEGESELSVLLAIREARLDGFRRAARMLPSGLVDVLSVALARLPSDRYDTAARFRVALAEYAQMSKADARASLGRLIGEAKLGLIGQALDLAPSATSEITLEPSLSDYRVEREDGGLLGPLTFAEIVEAVTVGRIGISDRISIGRGPFRPLTELQDLAAHLPARAPSSLPSPRLERLARRTDAFMDLAGGGIVEVLAQSAAAGRDGLWVCESNKVRKEIYILRGVPQFVTSNLPEELLGEFLVERDVIERGELEMALAVLPRFDGRLGDTLAALGLVEPVELFRHIAAQVRQKLIELFSWTDGQARFQPGARPPERGFPLGLDPWQILEDGINQRLQSGLEQETFASRMMDRLERTSALGNGDFPPDARLLFTITRRPTPLHELVELLEEQDESDPHLPYRTIRLGLALRLVRWEVLP